MSKLKNKAPRKSNPEFLLSEKSPFEIKEAYTQLRTNLLLGSNEDTSRKVFVITSPLAAEGKSLTAANIAISFAMLKKKVLLIDCDMRKPTQHRLWAITKNDGLSNLLSGYGRCLIRGTDRLSLDIITAGILPPNPSELLMSKRFSMSLESLREVYDYIIIDSPPVNIVSDTQIIAKDADGVLLIARSGSTDNKDLARAVNLLEQNDATIIGCVINSIDPQNTNHPYSYSYKYRYKYNYTRQEAPTQK